MSSKTILIVDDDVDVAESLHDALSDEGYNVVTARDGLEALSWLRSNPLPGVILLDWMMPRCDGLTFREAQVADPAIASVPVILLTADGRIAEKKARLKVHASLGKPVELENLLGALAPYVN